MLAGILERQEQELKEAYSPYCRLTVSDREDGWIFDDRDASIHAPADFTIRRNESDHTLPRLRDTVQGGSGPASAFPTVGFGVVSVKKFLMHPGICCQKLFLPLSSWTLLRWLQVQDPVSGDRRFSRWPGSN